MVYMDHLLLNLLYAIYIYGLCGDHMFLYGKYANSIQTRLDFSQTQQIAPN